MAEPVIPVFKTLSDGSLKSSRIGQKSFDVSEKNF